MAIRKGSTRFDEHGDIVTVTRTKWGWTYAKYSTGPLADDGEEYGFREGELYEKSPQGDPLAPFFPDDPVQFLNDHISIIHIGDK